MHRAFDSEDIIYSVLKYLEPKDLKNVAMTCSRLAGSVFDILWSEQSSLVPLIMCLPQDTWEIKDDTINLTREPTPSERERFRTNASRVRRLIVSDPGSYEALHPKLSVSGLVLRWLFEQFPPTTLFRNLCVFDSHALLESSSDLSLVRKFLSPRLESLMLDASAPFPTHEVEQFLAALPIEAQGLRQLSISMDDGATAFAVPPSFGKLPKLITLSIHRADVCLTRHVITNIQQARCLKTLMLSLRGTSYDGGVMALELSSLENLVLSGDVLPQCTHLIRQITTRQLSVVNIEYFQPASPMDITVFMESLSTSCQNYASLKHVYVADTTDPEDTDLVIPLSSEVFRPLLKFTGLLSVVFGGIGNYNLDDRFINDIPDAWPGIQKLKFASYRPASCAVTFTAMVSLASRCRSLQSLYLTCSATQSTIIPQAEDGTEKFWPTQTALRELHLGHSQVSEVARMPYILAKVFPALSFLDWYHFFGSFDIENFSERALEEVRYQLQVLQNLADPDDHDDIDDSDVEWEEGDDDPEDSEYSEYSDDDDWM